MSTTVRAKNFERYCRVARNAVVGAFVALCATTACAAVINVTTTRDAIANDGACSLREAVINANTDSRLFAGAGECPAGSGRDTINIPPGTYVLTIAPAGPTDASAGSIKLTSGVDIVGAGRPTVRAFIDLFDRVFDVAPGATVSLSGFVISGGYVPVTVEADGGGGIRTRGNLTLRNMTVSDSRAISTTVDSAGGGILVTRDGSLVMIDSTVTSNTAEYGAGIFAYGPITISGSTIASNVGTSTAIDIASGPGIFAVGAPATLTNTTITDNTSPHVGGALALSTIGTSVANATLSNVTISSNSYPDLYVFQGTATLRNSIIATNLYPVAASCLLEYGGKVVSEGGNIIGNRTGCAITGAQASDRIGTAAAQVNPLLGPLANNGGPTRTLAPMQGSPVVDAGVLANCAAKDQRGYVRPQGVACDIGAFEVAVPISGMVVEFFNTTLGHYFITASAAEQASIDAGGSGPGWTRTGNNFKSGGGSSACRFFGTPGLGPNSHFYTVDPAECAQVIGDPGWHFESFDFNATPPVSGNCAAGQMRVYRAYNNGFARNDSNHRYTTSLTVYNNQVAAGWSGEGVVFCAPV